MDMLWNNTNPELLFSEQWFSINKLKTTQTKKLTVFSYRNKLLLEAENVCSTDMLKIIRLALDKKLNFKQRINPIMHFVELLCTLLSRNKIVQLTLLFKTANIGRCHEKV